MLTEIKLLGKLGQQFGRIWNLHISSPAQAIRAIAANCPDFQQYLYDSEEKGIFYRVVIDDPLGIDDTQLHYPVGQRLIIAPIITGAGGVGKVIGGAALLVGSFFLPAAIPLFGATISSFAIGALGASLLLSGITTMLTPTPKMPKVEPRGNADPPKPKSDSFLFDRASELGNQGLPVPVGYGERIISDLVIISSAIVTQEIPIT